MGISCPAHCASSFVYLASIFPSETSSSTLRPFLWSPPLRSPHLALLLRPHLYACRRIYMSDAVALLVNAVKAAAGTLRLLADSLESAGDRAAAAPLVSFSDIRDWDLEDPAELGLGSSSAPPSSSPRASTRVGSSYDLVARSIPPLPAHCLDVCGRLAGTQEEVKAWDGGHWGKACCGVLHWGKACCSPSSRKDLSLIPSSLLFGTRVFFP